MVRHMAGTTGSSTVARQMQDRTHKGGAVLWFLRKHAPMPLPYADFLTDDDSLVTAAKNSPPKETSDAAAAGKGSVQRKSAAPQRDFLHDTLKAIGTELDLQHDVDDDGFGRIPHPQGSRVDSQSVAWNVRQSLRRKYDKHTESELAHLEAAVQAKEHEVASLRKQVEQMERYLAATQAAAARRSHRIQTRTEAPGSPIASTNSKVSPGGLANQLVKTKNLFLSAVGAKVWEADDGIHRSNRENVIEEWQHSIVRQSEISTTMRQHVDEQAKVLQQQTVQRKAQEAALFTSHSISLRLRAQVHQTEARVQRLANELKRVYKTLPETIQKKLESEGKVARKHHMELDFEDLKFQHRPEFFKYMECDGVQSESEACLKRIAEVEEQIVVADRVLAKGRWFAEASIQHARTAQTAIAALHDRFERFTEAGYTVSDLTLLDSHKGDTSNDAESVLQRATLAVHAINEFTEVIQRYESVCPCTDSRLSASSRHHDQGRST